MNLASVKLSKNQQGQRNTCHCDKLRDAATFKGKSSKSQVILYFLQHGCLDPPVASSNLKMKVVFVHSFVDPVWSFLLLYLHFSHVSMCSVETLPPGFQSLSCMFCSCCVLNTFAIPAIIFHGIGSPNKCSTSLFIKCLCHNSYWKRRIWNSWREMLLLLSYSTMVIWWMDGYGCWELHSLLKLGHTGQWFPCSYQVFC